VAGAVCVDASVALLWLLSDTLTPGARLLRRRFVQQGVSMLAPPIFRPEVTSTIRRWLYTSVVNEATARDALRRSLRLPVLISDAGEALQLRAFDIATALNRPRAYDSQYLALAEFSHCELWTADRGLVNAARQQFPWVRWLGDFQP
jgi:predicted nucleic acid-binding protein